MEVRCDKCQARYRVDDARIGPQGLTMRCGKCQNTFKVMRAEQLPTAPDQAPVSPAPKPAAAKPAARTPEPSANATMVFGQSPVLPKPAMPSASKPAAGKAAPASAKPGAPAPAPADEGAGRTMMFQTGNLKTSPAPKPKAEPPANATMVFGQSPVAAKPGAPVKPAAKAAEASPNATMVFGQSPLAPAKPVMPVAAKPAVARTTTPAKAVPMPEADAPVLPEPTMADPPRMDAAVQPEPTMADEPPQMEAAPEAPVQPEPTAADEPPQMEAAAEELPAEAAEEPMGDSGVQAEGAEESTEPGAAPDESTFDKAPPKGLFIGVAAGLAVLLLAGGALVAVKKLAKHPPPPAAVETLNGAQTEADKDTLASIASAEGKAKDALDVAGPKSSFPEGTALLARVEIQWADALNDEANALSAKNSDDPKVAELQTQAKAKVKSALDTLTQAFKADEKYKSSADMQLALADCFRAQHSNSNLNKALKVAQALKADDARLALVQGMASLQEDDGAEKAIPRLKVALAANPKSARVHYRLALAFQAMKDDANASTELKETMKISPQHERAKLALEAAASADGK